MNLRDEIIASHNAKAIEDERIRQKQAEIRKAAYNADLSAVCSMLVEHISNKLKNGTIEATTIPKGLFREKNVEYICEPVTIYFHTNTKYSADIKRITKTSYLNDGIHYGYPSTTSDLTDFFTTQLCFDIDADAFQLIKEEITAFCINNQIYYSYDSPPCMDKKLKTYKKVSSNSLYVKPCSGLCCYRYDNWGDGEYVNLDDKWYKLDVYLLLFLN